MTTRLPSATRRPPSVPVGPPFGSAAVATGEDVVLALDTSTRIGGVALCRGAAVLGEDTWQAGGHQTAQALPAAQRLWERAGLTPGDLRLVVVATGPGSFTGLRVGVSLAKGLALALGIPLVGVATLDALAYQQAASGAAPARLIAVVGAGRGQYYGGTYGVVRGQLRREGAFAVLTSDELRAAARQGRRDVVVCGEIEPSDANQRNEENKGSDGEREASEAEREASEAEREASEAEPPAAGEPAANATEVRFASPVAGVRRAAFLAELGRWVLATEGAADAALLQPIYLRRSPGPGDSSYSPPAQPWVNRAPGPKKPAVNRR